MRREEEVEGRRVERDAAAHLDDNHDLIVDRAVVGYTEHGNTRDVGEAQDHSLDRRGRTLWTVPGVDPDVQAVTARPRRWEPRRVIAILTDRRKRNTHESHTLSTLNAQNGQVLRTVSLPQMHNYFRGFSNTFKARGTYVVDLDHDGLDEISVCAPTRISALKDGRVKTFDLSPEQFFGNLAEPEALAGGDSSENAVITREILAGASGDKRNVVVLNAAAALICADKASDFPEGIKLAEASLDSGAARHKLDSLVTFTTENG